MNRDINVGAMRTNCYRQSKVPGIFMNAGRIDAYLVSSLEDVNMRTVAKFGTVSYYFATTKGNSDLLLELNSAMVIIYNKKLLKEAGLSAPESWADCLRPEFKGQIAYCMPSKSGSAYTQLCTMIQANGGKEAGWDYVEKFVANLNGKILDSSSKCHKLVANGEYMAWSASR